MATAYDRQVSTVAQHRSERQHSAVAAAAAERTLRVIDRIGQSVNLAVERFVTVGETIADDSDQIKKDMFDACKDARQAALSIERLCEIIANGIESDGSFCDRRAHMVRALRALLHSVTRVLLVADIVIMPKGLSRLEAVANFTEFIKAFAVCGAEMVELAHVTCNRQNDPEDERRRSQMMGAREVLERSSVVLLTSSKMTLRHPECIHAKENLETVFCQMRRAMDLIHFVIKDSILAAKQSDRNRIKDWDTDKGTASSCLRVFARLMESSRPRFSASGTSILSTSKPTLKDISSTGRAIDTTQEGRELMRSNSERDRHMTNHHHHVSSSSTSSSTHRKSYRDPYEYHNNSSSNGIKTANVTLPDADCEMSGYRMVPQQSRSIGFYTGISIISPQIREEMVYALNKCVEKTQDFTDSAYTTNEHRETILLLCDRMRLELNQCHRVAVNMEQFPNSRFDIDAAIDSVLSAAQDLSSSLSMAVADQIPELHHILKIGIELVNSLRNIALNQELDRLQECADRFHDYYDHILEVCKLLRHIALTETQQTQAKFTEVNLRIYGPQVLTAARALSAHPNSKIAKENLDVFCDMWQWLSGDATSVSKELIETVQAISKPDRTEYLSLPRPGKHGTTSKPLKAVRLDQEEQEKIAKAGLEMKMSANEMDAETDKWNMNDENNDIVKRAKNMSTMAFSMYQFTKGEGTLRTTQDLFTQAEYFAEEANRLYKVVRIFSYQVPAGDSKKELLDQLDVVPTYVQTLQFTVKDPTVGKAATFVKVDHVIRETKNLMNVINKVVTTCFDCAAKYKLDFSGLTGRSTTGLRDDDGGSGVAGDSKGSSTSTEASM
ncbi:alpha-catulin isoform X2 [Contarinia nasturtii]|uniref:alpha-catulin isoform X2 n=1 Tax=Contarinia nasturtii TaxID=265458 RepID=UPI0012D48472|nr:alpha-catulin isoform X2 [Contarinia nasturtii]